MANGVVVDLGYDVCGNCDARWRVPRPRCPRCGDAGCVRRQAAGAGVAAAVTRVMRPPSAHLAGPYSICLVDMDEGFRIMAHCADDIAVGSAVVARFVEFAGTSIPFFERSP